MACNATQVSSLKVCGLLLHLVEQAIHFGKLLMRLIEPNIATVFVTTQRFKLGFSTSITDVLNRRKQ
jgi:hypothetical protein